jgi:hypothetical protein
MACPASSWIQGMQVIFGHCFPLQCKKKSHLTVYSQKLQMPFSHHALCCQSTGPKPRRLQGTLAEVKWDVARETTSRPLTEVTTLKLWKQLAFSAAPARRRICGLVVALSGSP